MQTDFFLFEWLIRNFAFNRSLTKVSKSYLGWGGDMGKADLLNYKKSLNSLIILTDSQFSQQRSYFALKFGGRVGDKAVRP